MGEEIDKRNFRKRIKDIDFIEKTELIDKISSKEELLSIASTRKHTNKIRIST